MSFGNAVKGMSLVRTEVDGLDQPDGIEVAAASQIKGVRLVFAYGTGSIHGDVKIDGGSVPEGTMMSLTLRSAPPNNRRFTRQLEMMRAPLRCRRFTTREL